MGPRFRTGSVVLVEPVERRPRLGEVWVFCTKDGVILAHRFLRRRGDEFVFRGDAMPSSDAPVARSLLVGRVVSVDDGRRRWRPGAIRALPPLARLVRGWLAVRVSGRRDV